VRVAKIQRNNWQNKYPSNWNTKYKIKSDKAILGYVCEVCGSRDRVQRHHVIPVAKGGRNLPLLGIGLLCCKCHNRVHGKNINGYKPKRVIMR
jgi:5-methylcytosine-specific restriction endonuclease McrA